jgi:hypothetical protein
MHAHLSACGLALAPQLKKKSTSSTYLQLGVTVMPIWYKGSGKDEMN